MDPISAQTIAPAFLRPGNALSNDLAAVLREGRVLTGEVHQKFDGGSMLIAIGEYRVPATSEVELEVGKRFLFQVESHAGETVLRVLGSSPAVETQLLSLLRYAVAHEAQLGEALGRFARELSRLQVAPDSTAAQGAQQNAASQTPVTTAAQAAALLAGGGSVASALEPFVVNGPLDGPGLRELVARSGHTQESKLLQLAFVQDPDGVRGAAVRDLVREWLDGAITRARSVTGVSTQQVQMLSEQLARFIDGELDATRAFQGTARNGAEELLRNMVGAVERRQGEVLAQQMALELRTRGLSSMPTQGSALRAFEQVHAWSAALALSAQSKSSTPFAKALLDALHIDLKSLLLGVESKLPEGPAREAATRAAQALEAEQLLQIARRDLSEWLHLALPVAADPWTTAHLYHKSDGEDEDGGGDDVSHRIVLGVEFGNIGPVRVDISSHGDRMCVRFMTGRTDVLEALEARSEELARGLSEAGHNARLAFVRAEHGECRVDGMNHDLQFLREHHLMDVSG